MFRLSSFGTNQTRLLLPNIIDRHHCKWRALEVAIPGIAYPCPFPILIPTRSGMHLEN